MSGQPSAPVRRRVRASLCIRLHRTPAASTLTKGPSAGGATFHVLTRSSSSFSSTTAAWSPPPLRGRSSLRCVRRQWEGPLYGRNPMRTEAPERTQTLGLEERRSFGTVTGRRSRSSSQAPYLLQPYLLCPLREKTFSPLAGPPKVPPRRQGGAGKKREPDRS